MFNTYIYGTPLGFDFEDTASLKEYFKGLYISSRKGRRLMVNRRDNGETFYNYLRYGLAESEGRPNSFFGMSVSVDNNEFAYDFKEIFDWMDYLFDKLVERGVMFYVNAGNVIQYKIAKFKDVPEELQWLKSNIPNLFTKAQGVKLREYDSSFSVSSSGQIRCFNDETPIEKILEAFKTASWVALSPNFKPEEEPIEIDPYDIEVQLSKYTEQLVPIAISPKHENLSVLKLIEGNCQSIQTLIRKYSAGQHDEAEQRLCTRLLDKAKETEYNANTIAQKISSGSSTVHSPVRPSRKCRKCGRELPSSAFAHRNSFVCKECETAGNPQSETVKCVKCGREKDKSEFSQGSLICNECRKHGSIFDIVDMKSLAIIAVIVAIVGISLLLIFKPGPKDIVKTVDDQDSVTIVVEAIIVDKHIFDDHIRKNDFMGAFNEISGKNNSDIYIPALKSAVESYLWSLIEDPDVSEPQLVIGKFFIENRRVTDALGISEERWSDYALAYKALMGLCTKPSLKSIEKQQAYELLKSLPADGRQQAFKEAIDLKPTTEGHPEDHKPTTTPYIEKIYNGVSEKIKKTRGFECSAGEQVTLRSDKPLTARKTKGDAAINTADNKHTLTISGKAGDQVVVSNGVFQVTITVKAKEFQTL